MFSKHWPKFHLLNVSLLAPLLGLDFYSKIKHMENAVPFRQASCTSNWDFLGSKICTGRSHLHRYLSRPFAGILLPSCSIWTLRCVKIVGK